MNSASAVEILTTGCFLEDQHTLLKPLETHSLKYSLYLPNPQHNHCQYKATISEFPPFLQKILKYVVPFKYQITLLLLVSEA